MERVIRFEGERERGGAALEEVVVGAGTAGGRGRAMALARKGVIPSPVIVVRCTELGGSGEALVELL